MSNAPSICFILPHFHLEYSGGAEIQCYYLAQELLARNWEVHYIRESNETETKVMDGIVVHGIPAKKSYLKWQNGGALGRKMHEIKADIWYNRATLAYLPFITHYAKEIGGTVSFAFSRDSQFTYREFRETYLKLHMKLYASIEQFFFFRSLKQADRLLVQTQEQKRLLHQTLGLSGDHIYNAHPLESQVLQEIQRKPLILWIARIKHFKRPELFVEIARRLAGKGYQFKLVGKLTDDELSRNIQAEAAGVEGLELLGHQPSETVHQLLLQAKLLVSTSDVEGFSNTFIEAWLRGVPVYSHQVDPDEMIQTHGLGILEPDMDRLCEAIEAIMEAPALWTEDSARCKAFAHEQFDIGKAVDKLETVLLTPIT